MQFTWDVDPVIIHFGGHFGLRYYGILFSLVFIGGFLLFRWQVKRAGGSEDDAYNLIFPGAIGVVVGARMGHILFYKPWVLIQDPLWTFKIWEGGLASHGATIGIFLALWYYARQNRQAFLEVADRFMFSTAWGATLVRIGNFFNSEIVGRLTDQTWGVRFPQYDGLGPIMSPLRHPSQLYEACMGIFVLLSLFLADAILGREKRPRGAMAGVFLITYFSGRFLVEFFKEYQTLPDSFPLTMGQCLSIPFVLIGVFYLRHSLKKKTPAHWNVSEPVPAKAAGAGKKAER